MEIRPQLIAWSDHMVRSLPKEATFEMRAKQQAGASWTKIRVEGQAEGTAGAKAWRWELAQPARSLRAHHLVCMGPSSLPSSLPRDFSSLGVSSVLKAWQGSGVRGSNTY